MKHTVHIKIPASMVKKGIPVEIKVGDIIQTHFRNMKWKKYLEGLCDKHPELRAQIATYERTLH